MMNIDRNGKQRTLNVHYPADPASYTVDRTCLSLYAWPVTAVN